MAVGFCVISYQASSLERFENSYDRDCLCGSFRSDSLQDFILPYFHSTRYQVDPYDGGYFEGEELDELVNNLKLALIEVSGKPVDWPFEGRGLVDYYETGKVYSLDLLPPKEEAEAVIHRALELAQLAKSGGNTLFFIGD